MTAPREEPMNDGQVLPVKPGDVQASVVPVPVRSTAPREEFETALDADQAAWRSFGYHCDDAALQDQIYREGMEARATLRAIYAAAIERAEKAERELRAVNGHWPEIVALRAEVAALKVYIASSIARLSDERAALKAERDQNTDVLKLADEILHGGYAKVIAERDEWKQRAETQPQVPMEYQQFMVQVTAERDAARAALASLTFAELRAANVTRCGGTFHPIGDWSPTDWACAVAGEVGEACNMIKKLRRGEAVPIRDIAHEWADAVIYIDLACARLGIDLAAAIAEKFNIVSEKRGSDIRLTAHAPDG